MRDRRAEVIAVARPQKAKHERVWAARPWAVGLRYPCNAEREEHHGTQLVLGQVLPRYPVCEHPEACPRDAATLNHEGGRWWCSAEVVRNQAEEAKKR